MAQLTLSIRTIIWWLRTYKVVNHMAQRIVQHQRARICTINTTFRAALSASKPEEVLIVSIFTTFVTCSTTSTGVTKSSGVGKGYRGRWRGDIVLRWSSKMDRKSKRKGNDDDAARRIEERGDNDAYQNNFYYSYPAQPLPQSVPPIPYEYNQHFEAPWMAHGHMYPPHMYHQHESMYQQ
jgi:hypothetical protein